MRGGPQADLARLAGIHERYLGSIEEGKAVMSDGLRDRILGLLAPFDFPARHCDWCEQPIPPERDPRARFCCRQHAFDFHNHRKETGQRPRQAERARLKWTCRATCR